MRRLRALLLCAVTTALLLSAVPTGDAAAAGIVSRLRERVRAFLGSQDAMRRVNVTGAYRPIRTLPPNSPPPSTLADERRRDALARANERIEASKEKKKSDAATKKKKQHWSFAPSSSSSSSSSSSASASKSSSSSSSSPPTIEEQRRTVLAVSRDKRRAAADAGDDIIVGIADLSKLLVDELGAREVSAYTGSLSFAVERGYDGRSRFRSRSKQSGSNADSTTRSKGAQNGANGGAVKTPTIVRLYHSVAPPHSIGREKTPAFVASDARRGVMLGLQVRCIKRDSMSR
jgi:hypothetical protein